MYWQVLCLADRPCVSNILIRQSIACVQERRRLTRLKTYIAFPNQILMCSLAIMTLHLLIARQTRLSITTW